MGSSPMGGSTMHHRVPNNIRVYRGGWTEVTHNVRSVMTVAFSVRHYMVARTNVC